MTITGVIVGLVVLYFVGLTAFLFLLSTCIEDFWETPGALWFLIAMCVMWPLSLFLSIFIAPIILIVFIRRVFLKEIEESKKKWGRYYNV